MDYTKGEWHACHNGKCPCKQVWSDNYPVAQVTCGKWGDDYPSIRIVGESSLDLRAEAYIEQISYGEVPEKVAQANANLISAAPMLYEALKGALAEIEYDSNNDPNYAATIKGEIKQALSKAEGKVTWQNKRGMI